MDEKNVYAHEQMFNFNKFMKNRENDLKTILKRKVKQRKQNHIKTNFGANTEFKSQIQEKDSEEFGKEMEK